VPALAQRSTAARLIAIWGHGGPRRASRSTSEQASALGCGRTGPPMPELRPALAKGRVLEGVRMSADHALMRPLPGRAGPAPARRSRRTHRSAVVGRVDTRRRHRPGAVVRTCGPLTLRHPKTGPRSGDAPGNRGDGLSDILPDRLRAGPLLGGPIPPTERSHHDVRRPENEFTRSDGWPIEIGPARREGGRLRSEGRLIRPVPCRLRSGWPHQSAAGHQIPVADLRAAEPAAKAARWTLDAMADHRLVSDAPPWGRRVVCPLQRGPP
jgi:hypothetical protein